MMNRIKLFLFSIVLCLIAFFHFYPPAVECKKKGGSYSLNGECWKYEPPKMEMIRG